MLIARLFLILLLLPAAFCGRANPLSLSCSRPQLLAAGAASDKAVAIARFKEQLLVAWKDTGQVGRLNILQAARPGGHRAACRPEQAIALAAPVFQAAGDYLYLFWIGADSLVHYMTGTDASELLSSGIFTLHTNRPLRFCYGLSTAFSDSTLMIAAHAAKGNRLLFATCTTGDSGILQEATVAYIKNAHSAAYPSMAVTGSDGRVRITWADHRTRQLYFADYTPWGKTWSLPQSLPDIYTSRPATLAGELRPGYMAWIGNGSRKDNHLWYSLVKEDGPEVSPVRLPDYFHTTMPVTMIPVDSIKYLMAFTGTDGQLYYSEVALYDPATWIGDLLLPGREQYSLKDIVIPGAHDAGMSVLSGVGGQGAAVINECNTLTQALDIERQLQAGIRMFDLRMDVYEGELFTKHAPADCMDDAVGGGYGEKLSAILKAVQEFLDTHEKEFVILSFCHFCESNMSIGEQAGKIAGLLGADKIYAGNGRKAGDIRLEELSGKVLLTFEGYAFPDLGISANTMTEDGSQAGLNYRRAYAATNLLNRLLPAQQDFFTRLKGQVKDNDLVRLDWQLTEASQEAIFICNDFESERSNPLLGGAILLANAIKKNKSIMELGEYGNLYLAGTLAGWIDTGLIDRENKPNILYVDVAGNWITDFCVMLNQDTVYRK